ncbi:MAG: hypothetical protein U1F16_04370 [Turneriella sp.]
MLVISLYHPYFLLFDLFLIVVGGYLIGYQLFKRGFVRSYAESESKFAVLAWLERRAGRKNPHGKERTELRSIRSVKNICEHGAVSFMLFFASMPA